MENNFARKQLDQLAFEAALERDFTDIADHFITKSQNQIHLTWNMIMKMLNSKQEALIKLCIKH
jgi:hypothetical protein